MEPESTFEFSTTGFPYGRWSKGLLLFRKRRTVKSDESGKKKNKHESHRLFPRIRRKSTVTGFLNLFGNPPRITDKAGPIDRVIDRSYFVERISIRIHFDFDPVDFDKKKNEK